MSRRLDLTGMTFGRLEVLEAAESRKGKSYWLTKCSCGSEPKIVGADSLVQGKTVSCGCYRSEAIKAGREKRHQGTHQMSHLPEYETWRCMIRRCTNPKDRSYPRYGGRGITVCDRWAESFAAFLADVGPRPKPGMSIDRIDNDGNYEPSNVRWATAKEQVRNSTAFKSGVTNWKRADLIAEVESLQGKNAALLAEVAELRETVARVEALVEDDRRNRAKCAEDDNCPCAYKDCYECGKWHNCTHTPYTALTAALDGAR